MDYLGSLFKVRASLMVQWVKNLHANAGNTGDAGSIPGLGRSPEGGHSKPFQYTCLENPCGQTNLAG